jgi:tetratricopeptide (TPR) repeat protein
VALSEEQRSNALTVLTRLAQREPKATEWLTTAVSADPGCLTVALGVAIDTGEPMGQVLCSILAANPPAVEELMALQHRLPAHAMAVHPLALTIAGLIVNALPKEGRNAERVRPLTEYAERLSEAGQAERGLGYAAEAVRLATESREANQDPYGTIDALRVLSLCEVQSGQPKAAVSTAKKLLQMVQKKAGRRPDIEVAVALATLSIRMPIGEPESIAVASQAIELLRTIASASLSPLQPLRQALQQLQPNEPLMIFLGSAEELDGTSRHRHLMPRGENGEWSRPSPVVILDPHAPDPVRVRISLATVLNSRASMYLVARRPHEALADASEAIAILRETTTGQIDDPGMMLAVALKVAAHALFDLNETDKAIPVAQEAVSRLWPFALAQGTAYWREFIGIETRLLGAVLEKTTIGEITERMRAMIALLSRRDPQDRAELAATFADIIESLADFCCDQGWFSSGLWACVVDCCRLASQDRPDAIPQLARALTSQATALHRDGQAASALPVAEEAVELSLRWAEQTNDGTYPMAALHGLARRLAALDRFDEAADTVYQAIQRALLVADQRTNPPLALFSFIHAYSNYAEKAGRHRPSYEAGVFPAVAAALDELSDESDSHNLQIIATAAFSVLSAAARMGDVPATSELYRKFSALARSHADDNSLFTCHAMIAWNLMMCYVDHDALDLALGVYRDVARLASKNPALPLTRVEHGKCATEIVQAYLERGDLRMAQEIVRDADCSLRSPPYLAARAKDLGQVPDEFLHQLDLLLATAPEDYLPE